jgi:hypothetical protein
MSTAILRRWPRSFPYRPPFDRLLTSCGANWPADLDDRVRQFFERSLQAT